MDKLEVKGVVTQILRGNIFKVTLNNTNREIKCTISGRIRKNTIRILMGDKVTVELSPYNLDLGTIVYREL